MTSNLFPDDPSFSAEVTSTAPAGVVIESSAEQAARAQGRKPAAEKAASAPSRRELEAALEALAPTPEPEPTKYEVERALRQNNLSSLVVEFGNNLKSLGILDSKDLTAAKKAIDALGVASKSAGKAIDAIADAKLGLDAEPEKATRAPRTPKPAVEKPAEKTLPGKGPDEVAAELRAKQEADALAEPESVDEDEEF